MMTNPLNGLGKILILVGVFCIIFGLFFVFRHRFPWIGRLPGDIYVKREGFVFYFPLATSILISLILSLLIRLFR